MKTVKTIYLLFLLALLPMTIKPFLPWRYNDSASLPLGYYWKGDRKQATKGTLISFCLPKAMAVQAKARGYIGFGLCPGWTEMLVKPIAATEGDVVNVTPEGVSINGETVPNTKVFEQDSKGRRYPARFLGVTTIPNGALFCLAPYNERSFDSRYWGLLSQDSIVETMKPAWIW